jgi:16S rRNA (cytosine967-C5)-methyltransferase
MNGTYKAAGFELRRAAAQRLQLVLSGAPFLPFTQRDVDDPRDRAMGNKLITICLKRHGQITKVIEQVLEKGLPKRAGIFEAALRMGIGQLLFLPDMGDHAAIHLAVEVIKKDRRAGRFAKLANAALRNVQRQANELNFDNTDLVPAWLLEKWQDQFGEARVNAMLEAMLEDVPLDLTFKTLDRDYCDKIGATPTIGLSARVSDRDTSVEGIEGYENGDWWVQDVAATLPVMLANVKPGQTAIDICAAPGGKTAQLAASGAIVTAIDNDGKRLTRVQQNLDRLQLQARLIEFDATKLPDDEQYDVVMVDAPCSATGTFRRHPEVVWHRRQKDIAQRAELQKSMLECAQKLVKPGGTLVFCTCSLEHEEGEAQADAFLDAHGDRFELLPIMPSELDGLSDGVGPVGYLRTLPGMKIGEVPGSMDGFFAARFVRKQ